jgi:hypothetical protein
MALGEGSKLTGGVLGNEPVSSSLDDCLDDRADDGCDEKSSGFDPMKKIIHLYL